jgi:hypothetical protein
MRTTCWINRTTDTHSEHVIIISFQNKNCYVNAPKFYVHSCTVCLVTVELTLAANNIKPFTVAIETQEQVSFALLAIHRMFLTAVKK